MKASSSNAVISLDALAIPLADEKASAANSSSHACFSRRATPDKTTMRFNARDPLVVWDCSEPCRKKKERQRVEEKSLKRWRDSGGRSTHDEEKQLIPSNKIACARRYQIEILQKALRENTIAFLETGCGKTLIAVLLIRQLGYKLRLKEEKRIAVFLAPTVHLVIQQFEVLKINTDLKVDSYYGAKGVDYWSHELWQAEIDKNEVLVMTPQVFLDALRHSFMMMDTVEVLILDECHHTQKHHAYAKIMREYYMSSLKKPKVFGLTASPVIRRGVSSSLDCVEQMQRLETMLDSKVYSLQDRNELEFYAPTPHQKTEYYEKVSHAYVPIIEDLGSLRDKVLSHGRFDDHKSHFNDHVEFTKKLRKKIRSLYMSLEYCLQELGFWCAFMGAETLRRNIEDIEEEPSTGLSYALRCSKKEFLKDASQVLKRALPNGIEVAFNTEEDIAEATQKGFITPKVKHLVCCLLQYRDVSDMRCIVFVERVIGAVVLAELANSIGCLSFVNCHFLAGSTATIDIMGRKKQQRVIDEFRVGKVNVLIATDVAEEGLDVQSCSSVIRFDLSKSVRSFIQSRGRARRHGSDYVIFVERNNLKQEELLLDIIRSEESIRSQALNRMYKPIHTLNPPEHTESYRVKSTGATINTDSSISFIYRFCSKLPGDKYYVPRPEFRFERIKDGDLHVCILTLPPNGPFSCLVGPPRDNLLVAKQAVCLEACEMLHNMGQVTDHLLPVIDMANSEGELLMKMDPKNVAGPGTTRKKELYSTAEVPSLRGTWINSPDGALVQAYKLSFTLIPEEDSYSSFVLLIDSILDADVANLEIELFLTRKRKAIAKLTECGMFELTSYQLQNAKVFQEVIFNGMFSKLIRRGKNVSQGFVPESKILLASRQKLNKLWALDMYLLLPLIDCPGNSVHVDWKAVNKCATMGSHLTMLCSHKIIESNDMENCESIFMSQDNIEVLHLATGQIPRSHIIDMAVVTIHLGKIYCVTEVLHDKNADSSFPNSEESNAAKYASYTEYFQKKYGRILKFSRQPLLKLKQTHRLHNLLIEQNGHLNYKASNKTLKDANFVEIPPELCLNLGVSSPVIRSLYLFPSCMHRLYQLMLASQLRCKIQATLPQCKYIPASRISEALTTLRCLDRSSFEGLELLGDSFLKYAVSRYLFLKYEKKHEGQLSAIRCRSICNATLHHQALLRELPGYIRDEPFDPILWTAPGMKARKVVKCKCNSQNLMSAEKTYQPDEENTNMVFKIGKSCNKGHRWMCSKTIADCVEALIGAYYDECGSNDALQFMTWMGMEVTFDRSLIDDARQRATVHPLVLQNVNIEELEALLGYEFKNKALLVESLTHASQQDPHGGVCYQRLEFLGDAALDLLITTHLFRTYPGLTPGFLTDLRSAAVNNECFARAAIKYNLQRYLRHGSGELLGQITQFVKAMQDFGYDKKEEVFGWDGAKGPKVLGDLVESIAGAILVDCGFDLSQVWKAMQPLLAPIVSPETLALHPIRELLELCQLNGYGIRWKEMVDDNKKAMVTCEVRLEKEVVTGTACKARKKLAKKDAAQQILDLLGHMNIWHPRRQFSLDVSKRVPEENTIINYFGQLHEGHVHVQKKLNEAPYTKKATDDNKVVSQKRKKECSDNNVDAVKRLKFAEDYNEKSELENENVCSNNAGSPCFSQLIEDMLHGNFHEDKSSSNTDNSMGYSKQQCSTTLAREETYSEPSFLRASQLGGGRKALHEYCCKQKWPGPHYELLKEEGAPHSRRFTFSVAVYSPLDKPFKASGLPMKSKNEAKDTAALKMLFSLQNIGLLKD